MTMSIKRRDTGMNLFHALSDDTRLAIMERLKEGEQCVGNLTDALKAGQSRLSFHLKVLKDAGLIADRPEGGWMYYSLTREVLEELEAVILSVQGSRPRVGSPSWCREFFWR